MVNMLDTVENTSLLNPYEGAWAYDPVDDLSAIDARFDEMAAAVQDADTDLDWAAILSAVTTEIDQVLTGSAEIDAEVQTFETEHLGTLAKSHARLAAGYSDIGAINSSAYTIALALLEDGFNTDVAKFRGDLKREARAQRAQMITMGVNAMTKVIASKVDMQRLLFAAQADKSKMNIIANKEYLREEILLAEQDAMWNLEVLRDGSALLGAVAGVGMRKTPMPAWASGLSGAMGGAAMMLPIAPALGVELGTLAVIGGAILGGAAGATQGTAS
jgi:hypothetical protein